VSPDVGSITLIFSDAGTLTSASANDGMIVPALELSIGAAIA
jgi:hypothetical protein